MLASGAPPASLTHWSAGSHGLAKARLPRCCGAGPRGGHDAGEALVPTTGHRRQVSLLLFGRRISLVLSNQNLF